MPLPSCAGECATKSCERVEVSLQAAGTGGAQQGAGHDNSNTNNNNNNNNNNNRAARVTVEMKILTPQLGLPPRQHRQPLSTSAPRQRWIALRPQAALSP